MSKHFKYAAIEVYRGGKRTRVKVFLPSSLSKERLSSGVPKDHLLGTFYVLTRSLHPTSGVPEEILRTRVEQSFGVTFDHYSCCRKV